MKSEFPTFKIHSDFRFAKKRIDLAKISGQCKKNFFKPTKKREKKKKKNEKKSKALNSSWHLSYER